jgi:drug/metabolite transporter (DMT)-like permease
VNGTAVAVAAIAAVSFGWSTALMHQSASRASEQDGHQRFTRLIAHLLTQPRWLIGMFASLTGLVLHAWALSEGSIAVVQPVVVTGLVFAFLFRALLDRQWPSVTLLAWVGVTACGIAVFLVGAKSTSSSSRPDGHAATVFVLSGVVVILAGVLLSRRARPNRAGFLLGVSGGVVFGMIAGVLKALTDSSSLSDAVTGWPLYVLMALGATGFSINQLAYATAPLVSSLPVLNVINPVIGVCFGFAVFHERPSGRPLMVGFELIGLLLVLTGVAALAIADERSSEPVAVDA